MVRLLAPLFVALVLLAPAGARAETYATCTGFIDSLPATLTTQGTWCLRGDLATAIGSGSAIRVSTNNVTIDCNGFKVGGLGAGRGTSAVGIYTYGYSNTTVRNCAVRGFAAGIVLNDNISGGRYLVEHNRLDGNTQNGIYVAGFGSVVRGNRVFDTGGSTASNSAVAIATLRDVLVQDNIIHGVYPEYVGGVAHAVGINVDSTDFGMVSGNQVMYVDRSAQTSVAIQMFGTLSVVRGNHVGTEGKIGIQCGGQNAASNVAVGNTIMGPDLALSNCRDEGNITD